VVIVRQRNTGFVLTESCANPRSDASHGLKWYHQREYRHQKQPHSRHAKPPDSKNVLGCRLVNG